MKKIIKKFLRAPIVMLTLCTGILFVSGCARYARNINTAYDPSTIIQAGTGKIFIVIPEDKQTQSPDVKWVIGKVLDDNNNQIDEVFSLNSPAEIIQNAFGVEFNKAGYTVIPVTKRPAGEQRVIDLTKSEIDLKQISSLADIKSICRVVVGLDLFINGQMIKRLQYESSSTKTDIRDRDLLARKVLQEALQSVMLEAVPELSSLFKQ